jgi:hypothetical protein
MANAKEFSLGFEAGANVYLSVQRKADGYLMDDADGAFKVSPVADFALSMTANADQPSLYEASEARVAWSDGVYIVCFYLRLGGAPAPTTDPMIASQEMTLLDDEEVSGGGGGSTTINDSSVTNNSTTDADLADIRKLVKAILHDNKMILDKVGTMKGVLDARSNAGQKEAGTSRRR